MEMADLRSFYQDLLEPFRAQRRRIAGTGAQMVQTESEAVKAEFQLAIAEPQPPRLTPHYLYGSCKRCSRKTEIPGGNSDSSKYCKYCKYCGYLQNTDRPNGHALYVQTRLLDEVGDFKGRWVCHKCGERTNEYPTTGKTRIMFCRACRHHIRRKGYTCWLWSKFHKNKATGEDYHCCKCSKESRGGAPLALNPNGSWGEVDEGTSLSDPPSNKSSQLSASTPATSTSSPAENTEPVSNFPHQDTAEMDIQNDVEDGKSSIRSTEHQGVPGA